jgi:hypothetical protein
MSTFGAVRFNPANQSAFGTLETGELTPVVHLDFAYGINIQTGVETEVNSATVDTNGGRLRLQTGTNSAGNAIFQSRKSAKYRPGLGMTVRYTPLFTTGVASSLQAQGVFNVVSNALYDGYGFGFNGTSFGIVHYIAGTPTWVAQGSWNGDRVDGSAGTSFTWDKTKGTPVMIKYPFLGYGDIFFYVQHPTTGAWVLVHTIRYANTTATIQLSNPSLHFVAIATNSGNTSNLTMYTGSVGMFISGKRSFVGNPRWGVDSVKTGITTETNIISIQNCTSYNGVTNNSLIRLSFLSFGSSAASGNAFIRFKIGATLGGTPSYTTVNGTTADNGVTITSGNSVASYDVAGTTVTGGNYVGGVTCDNPNSSAISLEPYDLFISPGEILTISGYSSVSSAISVALNISEDI